MKVVIFGIGEYYRKNRERIEKISDKIEILTFIDNSENVYGKMINGVMVRKPDEIIKFDFDIILLMSFIHEIEFRDQLAALGIDERRIYVLSQLEGLLEKGNVTKWNPVRYLPVCAEKKALIITIGLGNDGGSLVAIYAAMALQRLNYQVSVATSSVATNLKEEILESGIGIIIRPGIPYLSQTDYEWIKEFDICLVNLVDNVMAACEISKFQPVLWWIHENNKSAGNHYKITKRRFPDYGISDMKKIQILAVSEMAVQYINEYYPNTCETKMPFGIPDEFSGMESSCVSKSKMVFAVVAGVQKRKGQTVFVDAIKRIPKNRLVNAEFWIIGYCGNDKYSQEVRYKSKDIDQIKILGAKDRKTVQDLYKEIDVVVCPSLEETMSAVIVEGMMHKKVCITTSATGISHYIINGKNGFIVKKENVKELSETMLYCIENRGKMTEITQNARLTYENCFSMEAFSKQLDIEIGKAVEKRVI